MKRSQKGFSLLEVACILVLIGIVGIVAVPAMQQVRRQEVTCFCKEICTDLVLLKTELRRHSNDTYTLELIADGSQYTGYKIKKNSEVQPMTTRNGTAGFEVTIMDPSGSIPGVKIEKLEFEDGKIKANGAQYMTDLKIKIKSDDIEQQVTFDVNTGHYTIS